MPKIIKYCQIVYVKINNKIVRNGNPKTKFILRSVLETQIGGH